MISGAPSLPHINLIITLYSPYIHLAFTSFSPTKVLFHYLEFLDNCSLKRSAESLDNSIQEMVDLTHLETGFANLESFSVPG